MRNVALVLSIFGSASLAAEEPVAPINIGPQLESHPVVGGGILVTLQGRNLTATEYLAKLVELPAVTIVVDAAAEVPLKTTVLTVDLREREVDYAIELIGAAAGVDVEPQGSLDSFRLLGPALAINAEERRSLRRAAARFFQMALLRQRDAETASSALRGLADLHRSAGDYTEAYPVYEALLSRYPSTDAAADAELRLAECLAEVGDTFRANRVLRSFLDRCDDPGKRERALAHLVSLLLDARRFLEIEDLRPALVEMTRLSEKTLDMLANAAAGMIEVGRPEAAVLLLDDIWSIDPEQRAILGPVLALALVIRNDPARASHVLSVSAAHVRQVAESGTAAIAYAELAYRADRPVEAFVFAVRALRTDDVVMSVELRSHLLLADLYRHLGMIGRARAHGKEAAKLSPTANSGQFALESARLALAEGQPELARLLYQEALAHRGSELEAELGIARSLIDAGDAGRARDLLEEMRKDESLPLEIRERVTLLEVDCLEHLGEYTQAIDLLVSLGKPSAESEDAALVVDDVPAEEEGE